MGLGMEGGKGPGLGGGYLSMYLCIYLFICASLCRCRFNAAGPFLINGSTCACLVQRRAAHALDRLDPHCHQGVGEGLLHER